MPIRDTYEPGRPCWVDLASSDPAASLVDRGTGANVLGSPALALAHLAQVLAEQPPPQGLSAGEIVTTGTITDAWPIAPGESWASDYGTIGLDGFSIAFS